MQRLPLSSGGAVKVGLWAVLPEQYDDAEILLKNKKHKPELQLTASEIEELERDARHGLIEPLTRSVERVLEWIFGAAILLVVLYVGMGIWNDT
ncbi:MAG: hypothetical protein AAF004_02775 [Pseudomonadota bacterium]